MEFLQANSWLIIVVVAAIIALAATLIHRTQQNGGDVTPDAILEAGKVLARQAIFNGFKALADRVDAGLAGITPEERKTVAVAFYDALPETVRIGAVPVPIGLIKQIVGRDRFAGLVESEYQQFLNAFHAAKATVPSAFMLR